MEQLSSRLECLRLSNGYSKTTLGSMLGVSRRTVYAWETGEKEPTTSNIIQLARLYGVTSDYLLGLSDTEDRGAPSSSAPRKKF